MNTRAITCNKCMEQSFVFVKLSYGRSRELLESNGWKCDGDLDRDYCPSCWAKMRADKAARSMAQEVMF